MGATSTFLRRMRGKTQLADLSMFFPSFFPLLSSPSLPWRVSFPPSFPIPLVFYLFRVCVVPFLRVSFSGDFPFAYFVCPPPFRFFLSLPRSLISFHSWFFSSFVRSFLPSSNLLMNSERWPCPLNGTLTLYHLKEPLPFTLKTVSYTHLTLPTILLV